MESNLSSAKMEIAAWRSARKHRYQKMPCELRQRIFELTKEHTKSIIRKELSLSAGFKFKEVGYSAPFVEVPRPSTISEQKPTLQIINTKGIQISLYL